VVSSAAAKRTPPPLRSVIHTPALSLNRLNK
jgi:hypothetical protein